MEQFYGDSFDKFVQDSLVNNPNAADVFKEWSESPLDAMGKGLHDLMLSTFGKEYSDSIFSDVDWGTFLIEDLSKTHTSEDIAKALLTFSKGIQDKNVTVDDIYKLFSSDSPVSLSEGFINLIGHLNSFGESTKKAQSDWASFVEDASSGKLDASLSSIYEES